MWIGLVRSDFSTASALFARVLACVLLACAVWTTSAPGASTGSSTVGVTVPSATALDTSGCGSYVPGITSFGLVAVNTSNVTTGDCAVSFGSTNDSVTLRMFRSYSASTTALQHVGGFGAYDTTFAGDGSAAANPTASVEDGRDMALAPDGKVVVVGAALIASYYQGWVVRFNANGSLDTTFDGDGMATFDIAPQHDEFNSVVVQPDGKVVIGGTYTVNTATLDDSTWVLRLNVDGSLDTSFNGTGYRVVSLAAQRDRGTAVALQSDGKVLVTSSVIDGALNSGIARLTSTGALDTSFDADGSLTYDFGALANGANAVVQQPDGKVVWAGTTQVGAGQDAWASRLLADGSFDTTFNTTGRVQQSWSTGAESVSDVTLQSDGKLLLAGSGTPGASSEVALMRLTATGALDTGFDGDGKWSWDVSGGSDAMRSVGVYADGRIVAAGGGGVETVVVRLNADGTYDTTWDTDGRWTSSGVGMDAGRGLAIQPDGKLLVGGTTAGQAGALRFANGPTVADYSFNVTDWDAGAAAFGVCLRSVTGAVGAGNWTVDPNADCTPNDTDPWNAVPASNAAPTAPVAHSTAPGTVVANLRYGLRVATNQAPGPYMATVGLEVTAPGA